MHFLVIKSLLKALHKIKIKSNLALYLKMSTISSTISSAITPRDDGNEEDNHAAKKKRTKKLTETEKTLEEIQNFFEYHNTLNVQLASIVVKLRCFTQSINEILAFVRSLTTKVKNNELTDQYLFTFVANTFRYAVYLDALCGSVVDKPNQLISLPPWLISQEKVHGNYQTFQEYGKELSEKLNKKRNKTDVSSDLLLVRL
jgi:septal ring factor EnvC (AmiA/AmiB activator)